MEAKRIQRIVIVIAVVGMLGFLISRVFMRAQTGPGLTPFEFEQGTRELLRNLSPGSGTERMAELLERIASGTRPRVNPYANEVNVQFLKR